MAISFRYGNSLLGRTSDDMDRCCWWRPVLVATWLSARASMVLTSVAFYVRRDDFDLVVLLKHQSRALGCTPRSDPYLLYLVMMVFLVSLPC